ncbi:MAG: molybdopterin-dependent oxidoreductase [Pelagimonas sp.]|jgi:hypothetical protein|nr:molybdopterin-dependent oxidoreductase [Pelagimonas sp.]
MTCLRPLSFLFATLLCPLVASAENTSTDPVILTLAIPDNTQATAREITFTRAELMDLPATTYQTSTIWTEGVQDFQGVLLRTLLEHADLPVRTMTAHAINDYFATIPIGDITENGALVAYTLNGDPMSVRDKGPLWLIYPFDQEDRFITEQHFSRSVWQLIRLEIEE